jgi:hypothetical protein
MCYVGTIRKGREGEAKGGGRGGGRKQNVGGGEGGGDGNPEAVSCNWDSGQRDGPGTYVCLNMCLEGQSHQILRVRLVLYCLAVGREESHCGFITFFRVFSDFVFELTCVTP